MKFIIPILFLITFSTSAFCQNNVEKYDQLLSEIFKEDSPGATAIVAQGDQVLFSKGYGLANLEHLVAMQPDHVFEIGSITKQFTVVAIMMLVEEGKIQLEDDITTVLPEYPTHGHTITIHHLLTHTSGIKSYTGMEDWRGKWREDMTPEEMIDLFKNQPMDFAPGEAYAYNNSAYFMLGYIIEKVSGMTYEEYLQQKIFDPLGLENTYYGSQSQIIPNRANGYQKNGETLINAEYLSLTQPYAAGSIMSTIGDLHLWQRAITNNVLITEESKQQAWTSAQLNDGSLTYYGYGWGINEINDSPSVEHSGGIFGYNTNGIYLPEQDIYVAVLSNTDFISTGEVSTKMAAMAIGKPFSDKEEKINLPEDYLLSLTGVYNFDDGTVRYITYEDGQMYSQRKGSNRFEIYPVSKEKFVFDGSFATLIFDTKIATKATFTNRIRKTLGIKTDKPVPVKIEVSVAEEIMKTLVGDYEIQPGFILSVFIEDGQLITQATGQQKIPIFAKSTYIWFPKVMEAEIEFVPNDNGQITALILRQGGGETKAKKIK